jgi:hypothetical protein
MSFEEEAQRRWQQHLEELRGRVKRMESGEETLRSRVGSAWIDVTAQEIKRDKDTIKVLEDILARAASKTTGEATGEHMK